MKQTAERYHDFSYGHRVVGHEGKCRHLHGHNGRVHFTVEAEKLDQIGRVMDFGVIKEKLCMWVEDNWDHKFMAWTEDQLMNKISNAVSEYPFSKDADYMLFESIIWVPFNPTAENMAEYLVEVIGPQQLEGTGCTLTHVIIEETRKCSCSYTKE